MENVLEPYSSLLENSMIGIKAISSYIPKEGVDNFKQAETFEESASFVETKLGARFLQG